MTAACACPRARRDVQTCQRDGTFGPCTCDPAAGEPAPLTVRSSQEVPPSDGTLTMGTRRILGRLTGRLAINVYWSPGQPALGSDDERALRDRLGDFGRAAPGNLDVRWLSTDSTTGRRLAEESGCPPRALPASAEPPGPATTETFRCITLSYLGSTQRIDSVSPGLDRFEYEFSSIVRTFLGPQLTIGFLSGHGEGTLGQTLPYLGRILQADHLNYATRAVDLNGGATEVPGDISGLMVVGPTRRIDDRELRRLDEYLMRGGSIAVFASGITVSGADVNPTATPADHRLNSWLNGYGVTLNSDIILDFQASDSIQEIEQGRARVPMFTYPALVARRDVDGPGIDSSHPSLFRLPGLILPFVSSLVIDRARVRENGADYAEVARTSERSVAQREHFNLDALDLLQHRRQIFGDAHTSWAVGVALEGQLHSAFVGEGTVHGLARATSERPARLLVMGSGKLFDIDQMRAIAPLQNGVPTNVTMLLNVFDWLSGDADLLASRSIR